MARYTKKFIHARFEMAARAMGWNIGAPYANDGAGKYVAQVGVVYLDHVAAYGGWDVNQIVNDGGAITQLNGWGNRLSSAELVAFLDGLVKGAEAARNRPE